MTGQQLGETLVNTPEPLQKELCKTQIKPYVQAPFDFLFPGKYSGGGASKRSRPGPSDQEAMGTPAQHQPHPSRNSMHPLQPMQPHAQDKSSSSSRSYFCTQNSY